MKLLARFLEDELKINPEMYISRFELYEKLLLEMNKKINLVSRKTVSIEEHILNSVFFLKKYDISESGKMVDIGTGGGFPGIPLKILYPGLKITLLDSIQKKTNAIEEITSEMNLTEVTVICGRAEEISKLPLHKKKYEIVISKAVAPLDKLIVWGKDFLKPNGRMLCIKGGDLKTETDSMKKLQLSLEENIINYKFDDLYDIEDKKLVVLKIKQ